METDPDKINDYERKIEQSVFTEGQGYAARNARSKEENKGRAAARDRIKQLGMSPQAFGAAVALVKSKTPRELEDYLRDFNAVLKVLRQKQAELFPDEAAAALKREALREQKAAEIPRDTKALDEKTDNDKRSDPNKGGAKPKPPAPNKSGKPALTVAGGTDTAQAPGTPPPVPADEQAEGDAALKAGLAETTAAGKKKSQSQIAREIAEQTGTDQPITGKLN